MTRTDDPGDAPAVWLLAVGQTLGYACLYYSFGALLVDLEAGTGWTKAQLAIGPTLGLVTAALAAPFSGRLVDQGLGGELLILGPLIGAAALVWLGLAATPAQWVAGWIVAGLAQSASLYDTCFAFLTRRLGTAARPAIIRVTLVAGLASTLAFPLGAAVAHAAGHGIALMTFAGLLAFLAAPLNGIAVIRLRRRALQGRGRPAPEPGALSAAMRRPAFWMLAAIFSLGWLNHSMLITYAVPIFTAQGAGQALAVTAAACVGPAQVTGRLLLMLNEARIGTHRATAIALAAMTLASALLLAAGTALPLVFAFAVLQGGGIGLMSILRPVLTAEVLGRYGFGVISGALAVAPLMASAGAPTIGAGLLALAGPAGVVTACLVMAGVALALAAWVRAEAARSAP